jgi:thiosulfate/3-mercaptopyruvate sulfurtransferase
MTQYARPDAVVTTAWVAEHGRDRNVRLVEVNVDTSLYARGHIEGAIGWNWKSQLADPVQRDILSREDFEDLMSESGITEHTTVILFGDSNNWFAAWAFWQMKVYGHRDVRMMDGGRRKWEDEARAVTRDVPCITPTKYRAREQDISMRAFLHEVRIEAAQGTVDLVDVRSPQEFTGELLAPPGLPETCQRGGHIPGAANIPWSRAFNEADGTFKGVEELRRIYRSSGISFERPIIAYCRIGERSSHTWFVLKYLLGHENTKNYDGSWTEWGNLVGAPVATGH